MRGLVHFALLVCAVISLALCCGCQNEYYDTVSQAASEAPESQPSPSEVRIGRIDEIYNEMTQKERVCQLIIARNPSKKESGTLKEVLSEYPIGGICLFKYDFEDKGPDEVTGMIADFQAQSPIPLFICVDEEGGTVVRLSSNKRLRASKFESPQKIFQQGGMQAICEDTAEKSEFLKDLGINVNFAPVADVVTEKDAFLYPRAFGRDTKETAEYVRNVVAVMKQHKMGSSIKHFPGYGNSKNDTHKGLDINTKSLSELEHTDLPAFQAGIEAGADAIMVTHTVISAIDSKNPASMSPSVIDYIRQEMGFDAVIITDGLDMGAVIDFCAQEQDPALAAILAGADIALTPKDAAKSCEALLRAEKEGVITAERLEKSVKRIINMKLELGLLK